ncbi:trans-sialidase, putative [Trypanosoma cruzi]|uniref:Trans-sialidase, putative n=1 Tax=Trypanosoma cruzi (strain CL Brener) TaxID=353153 RepID=Q4D1G5_TRYCC|nr:trans-sialidase, putative [Trypanosoma cruzi]EAN86366.1 trans-sialidase, putative [Trypanosoma cruzi]|eukprot:XP_808217.1 trans-sialidase [Trypanosoma cruzi strain CL Brener]
MLSRVAAVKAPRTHNRRRVTGSSGGRREGRESEPQRPNMSRHHFFSALVLLIVVMVCCNAGGAAGVAGQPADPQFKWRGITGDEKLDSLGAPSLLKVGSDVFAVAEAKWKKDDASFTGIASQLLTTKTTDTPEEVLKNANDGTQLLEGGTSKDPNKRVDVSRPTTAVRGNDICMLAGVYINKVVAPRQDAKPDANQLGLLLVKGNVSEVANSKKIVWKDTESSPQRLFDAQLDSWTKLIGSGGSGVKMEDETLVFPVEGTKKKADGTEVNVKTISLIIHSKDNTNWTLSKGMSDGGCSDPSVVGWKDKTLIMMTACADGRRRVYESDDKGDAWAEALGTLSRVWGSNRKPHEKGVRSGFITATFGNDGDNKKVMLVTLPVYPEDSKKENGNEKGVLHLWLTDNTHIVDIGPVSGKGDDAAASSLLYRSDGSSEANNNEELIALYEKKKDNDEKPSPGVVSVLLTAQLERVKEVLTTWKEVDKRVSKLCATLLAQEDRLTENDCSGVKITDGLVGFLSGQFSEKTWMDEYLGVNATIAENDAAAATGSSDGVKFTGRGAGAQWPVGEQGENQLYHFANHKFTLVATVSIDGVPEEGDTLIPLMGVKMNDSDKTVLLGLSYNNKKKWLLLCDGGENKELSITWQPGKKHQLAIVLQNGKQGSAYVDGKRVGGDEQCTMENTESKVISHFYIGGDGGSAEIQEGVFVTVTNVLLYNRPLSSTEIGALNPNKASTPPAVPDNAQGTPSQSSSAGQSPSEPKLLNENQGADSGGASASAVSTVSIPSAENGSVKKVASGKSSDGTQTVDGGSTADGEPKMEKREGGTDAQEEVVQPQVRKVNATALNSNLGSLSQGNNSDAGTVSEGGLLPSLVLLLGLWGFAAL